MSRRVERKNAIGTIRDGDIIGFTPSEINNQLHIDDMGRLGLASYSGGGSCLKPSASSQ